MKYFFVLLLNFIIIFPILAADDNDKKIELPDTFDGGDPQKGATLVESCAACHGSEGVSISPDWPKLAGQNQKYLYKQLKYFKDGSRMNALMMSVTPYLQTLNDKDLMNISAFYASKQSSTGQARNDEELLNTGTALYRLGNSKKNIPACTSCHSVYGQGNSLAGYPSVAGQQIGYLKSSLIAYRSKERNAGEKAAVMQAIAANLTDYEIEALANYMHGLYR